MPSVSAIQPEGKQKKKHKIYDSSTFLKLFYDGDLSIVS